MRADDFFSEHLHRSPIVAILRAHTPERTVELCHTVWEIGISLVEVPIQGALGCASFTAAVTAAEDLGQHVGAGTVLTPQQVEYVCEMGGTFAVSPGTDDPIVEAALDAGLPHLPGVASSSDISRALRWGLRWVKAFPAAQLGVDWFRAQRDPFPDIEFVATGGIGVHNWRDFLAAGCQGVGVGGALEDHEFLREIPGSSN